MSARTPDRTPVRVVIADDHPMFRYGLTAALASSDEVEVVGEAASGEELLAVVDSARPDIVITDLAMPGTDGATATRALLARHVDVGVLVLTMHEDDQALFGALRAGARGYLLKGADRTEIIRAVLAVAAGDAVYGAVVARRIMAFFTGAHQRYAAQVFPELTERELEVLELVAVGHGNHEIARQLCLAEKTVRNHVSAIILKLGVRDRAAAVATARDAGLGTTGGPGRGQGDGQGTGTRAGTPMTPASRPGGCVPAGRAQGPAVSGLLPHDGRGAARAG
jgi:DNA-binding NarL/FixJ family response regulator